MGFFKMLGVLAIDTITAPIAVIKDVATLGGAITDQDEPYTVQKVKQISDDVDIIRENLID